MVGVVAEDITSSPGEINSGGGVPINGVTRRSSPGKPYFLTEPIVPADLNSMQQPMHRRSVGLMTFSASIFLVVFHDGPRRYFLGPLAITA
jgi:hypothetical protein